MIRIGFVLLSHSQPDQLLALSRILSDLYDSPPIVCHHDFGQAPIDKQLFPSNLRFVEPHLPTYWGCFSIVPATLTAIRMLMRGPNPPDWFYLLSGSDYPTLAPDQVRSMLASANCDVFIDHRPIRYRKDPSDCSAETSTGFGRPSYSSLAYRRYCAVALPRPSLAKPFSIPPVGRTYLYSPAWRTIFPGPFGPEFRCFAGEHWFTANAAAAEFLLCETPQSRRLYDHLRHRESPEECYYHTIFGNAPLRLENSNLRYIDWPTSDAWHPRTLTVSDLEKIKNSQAHFARKIAFRSELINQLNCDFGVAAA